MTYSDPTDTEQSIHTHDSALGVPTLLSSNREETYTVGNVPTLTKDSVQTKNHKEGRERVCSCLSFLSPVYLHAHKSTYVCTYTKRRPCTVRTSQTDLPFCTCTRQHPSRGDQGRRDCMKNCQDNVHAVCMSMYVRQRLRVGECLYFTYVCICLYAIVRTECVYLCQCTCVCIYVCPCTSTYVCQCRRVCMYACMRMLGDDYRATLVTSKKKERENFPGRYLPDCMLVVLLGEDP